MRFFLSFLLFCFTADCISNRTSDSLKALLPSLPENEEKAMIYMKIADIYHKSNKDSTVLYINKSLEIADKIGFKEARGHAIYTMAQFDFYDGNYQKVIDENLKAIGIFEEINNNKGIAKSYTGIGLAYDYWGKYDKATEYYLKALTLMEKDKNYPGIVANTINIGIVYYLQRLYEKSLDYYNKAYLISQEHHVDEYTLNILNNIALIFSHEKKYENAIKYYREALDFCSERGDNAALSTVSGNLGLAFAMLEQLDSAEFYFNRAFQLNTDLGDKTGLCTSYKNLGNLSHKKGDNKKALELLKKGLILANSIQAKNEEKNILESIIEIYEKTGDYKSAFTTIYGLMQLKDSLVNQQFSGQLAEMETLLQTEKKDKEIELQKSQLEKKSVEGSRQKLFIWLIAMVAIAVAIIALIIFRSLTITKKQKTIIEIQKNEVSRQKEIVEEQKNLVDEHQKEIIDSINYAKRLQDAILPSIDGIGQLFKESFVFYRPKDIVAGDFYWVATLSLPEEGIINAQTVFIAACDCTGHGVPGALVSVVCSNALNRAVKEFRLSNTGEILDKVSDLVLETFEKGGSEVKDGMDISLLKIEHFSPHSIGNGKHVRLQWSGANNPLLFVQDGKISEIKADKQPIGKFDNRKPFTTHAISHSDNSIFYLFTDGLADQFGGPKGKKFKYKQLKEKIIFHTAYSLEEQKNILEKTFREWKGNLMQVDDITVIGIKI